jgi:small subunit ribosomal protein S9
MTTDTDETTAAAVETDTAPAAEAPAAPTGPQVFVWGTGRRKTAVARVRVAVGTGKITINGRELNDFLTGIRDRKSIFGPLEVTNAGGKLDVHARCTGGGPTGQAGAVVMGLARALLRFDPATEAPLRSAGFLTRDSRMKERKKYGQRGARRRFQFSKR